MTDFNLAEVVDPGSNRLWVIEHQPKNQTKPLRIELREFTVERRDHTPVSFTKLIGSINTIADPVFVTDSARTLLTRVGRVQEFVGAHERAEK